MLFLHLILTKRMRTKFFFIFSFLFILGVFLLPGQGMAREDKVCATYFTYVGCPNCAQTDPMVLEEWPQKYEDLVVIEYMWHGGDWKNPNSEYFGDFAKEYGVQAAVPQIILDKGNVKMGRISVSEMEDDIQAKDFSPCPLLRKSVSFSDLDLRDLPAQPKLWTKNRILINSGKNSWLFQWNGENVSEEIKGEKKISNKTLKNLLFTSNIPGVLEGNQFTVVEPEEAVFSGSQFPNKDYVSSASFENAVKIELSPDFFTSGENVSTAKEEDNSSKQVAGSSSQEKRVEIPLLGTINTENFSLPVLTFLLGLADGFNPCAFFILTFLLAALIGLAGARKKIFIVGGIFIFFSALFYFFFMAVLFNVFQLGQEIMLLTVLAGIVAIIAGAINIKDYFAFQKGVSLTMPKSIKEKFMQRVKNLSLARSTWALAISAVVIAATVNIYELLCTFGFPMVYTSILTLRELNSVQYYLYLVFYNLVYILPLAIIVVVFAVTLGKRTFDQLWVKRLKLISGLMIFFLGSILIIEPKMLESASTAFGVLLAAIIISIIIFFIKHIYNK